MSWEAVGCLTLKRHRALYRQLRRHPPTHWLVAAFLGWTPHAESKKDASVDIRDLFDCIPGAGASKALTTAMLPLLGLL